jgi:hypothetical protein
MKSAQAIAAVSGDAFKILNEMMKEGRSISFLRAMDASASRTALAKALPGKTELQETLLRAVNRGNIDIGSASREQQRAADGRESGVVDAAFRIGSSFGYYSETFTRLVAAMAADRLYDPKRNGSSRDAYIDNIVNESMLNYSEWNTARGIGRSGFAGPLTPLMLSFKNYQLQVLEKLYREFYHSFKGTAEQKTQARRFLAGHLAAMTAISGTLGLPFASVAAGAYDALKDLFGDDDDERSDVKNDLRKFYAEIFGNDIGEVLARGVPHAVGVDVSKRAGEQDILPFAEPFISKRKWEDAIKDWVFEAQGAPLSMANNIILGARGIMRGDVVDGSKQLVPVAFKGMIEAYRMAETGAYVDKQGRELPMTPGAKDILTTFLGLNPANKSEYQEQRKVLTDRRDMAMQRAVVIRQHLATAMEHGDQEETQKWMAEAQQFDEAHPESAVLPRLNTTLQKRANARATAPFRHVPLETSLKDTRAAGLTSWANY